MAIQVVGRVINGTSGYDNFVGNEWSDTYRMTVNYGVTDMVDGGKGTDTLSYVNADRGVKVTMGSGTQLGHTEADFVTLSFFNPVTGQYFQNVETKTVTQFKGIENVTGSSFADTITGNSAANRIDAGAGRDTIDGGGGADTIISGRESDQIWGGEGPDTFVFNHFLDSSQSMSLERHPRGRQLRRGCGCGRHQRFPGRVRQNRPLRHRRQFHHIRQSGVRVRRGIYGSGR